MAGPTTARRRPSRAAGRTAAGRGAADGGAAAADAGATSAVAAPPPGAAGGDADAPAADRPATFFETFKGMAARTVLMWAAYMYVYSQAKAPRATPDGGTGGAAAGPPVVPVEHRQLTPAWPPSAPYALRVYTAETPTLPAAAAARLPPLWAEDALTYDWADGNTRSLSTTVPVPPAVASANGSLYAHFFFAPPGLLDPPPPAAAAASAGRAAGDAADAGGGAPSTAAVSAAAVADHAAAVAAAEGAGRVVHAVKPLVVWSAVKPKRQAKSLLEKKGTAKTQGGVRETTRRGKRRIRVAMACCQSSFGSCGRSFGVLWGLPGGGKTWVPRRRVRPAPRLATRRVRARRLVPPMAGPPRCPP